MITVFLIGCMLFAFGFVLNLFASIFSKNLRRKAVKSTILCFFGFIMTFVAFGLAGDKEARKLGWEDMAEQTAAKKFGIEEPTAWREQKDQLLAEEAAAEATKATEPKSPNTQEPQPTEVVEAEAPQEAAAEPEPQSPPQPEQEAATISEDQENFLIIVENGRSAYLSAQNEMQKGASKPARAKALCNYFLKPTVKEWRGKITQLTTNGDGKGVLAISVGEDATVMTHNNAFSDRSDKTLIEPGTPLYGTLLNMNVGDDVVVSGTFLRDKESCLKEMSLTMYGSMTDPEFIFRFAKVEPAEN